MVRKASSSSAPSGVNAMNASARAGIDDGLQPELELLEQERRLVGGAEGPVRGERFSTS